MALISSSFGWRRPMVAFSAAMLAFSPQLLKAGPRPKQLFTEDESARLQEMQALSLEAGQERGGFAEPEILVPVLLGAAVVGVILLAADYEDHGPECIIDGQRIDSDSLGCQAAKERAEFESLQYEVGNRP